MCRIKELIDDREKLHDQVDSLSFAANAAKCELETYKESNTDWKQEYKLKESVCEGLVHQLDLLEQVKDELERTKKNAEDMKIAKEVAEVNIAARDNYTEGLEKKLKLAQTKQKETEEETKVLKSKVEKAEKELIDSITAVKSLEKNDDIQGGMITELSKKLKCHVQTIRQLQRSGPGVNHIYVSGKGIRQSFRKQKRCNVEPCQNWVQHCEMCGKNVENNYCRPCRYETKECTFCMYICADDN